MVDGLDGPLLIYKYLVETVCMVFDGLVFYMSTVVLHLPAGTLMPPRTPSWYRDNMDDLAKKPRVARRPR